MPSKQTQRDATIIEILAAYYEPIGHGRRRPESIYGPLNMRTRLQHVAIQVAKSTADGAEAPKRLTPKHRGSMELRRIQSWSSRSAYS